MLAAAHASTERIADAARLSQLGMDVGGGTTAVVLSVEECNRQFRPLAEAYATAKSLEDSELMDELRPQLDLWRGRIKAAAAAGANAALKREAEEDFCDNGDISAAKVLKTASGAPAVTAPLSEAARAAGVSALAQRPRALQAGLVSVLTPVVAADVKALPSGGTNLRQAVTTVALAHASGAVKDMANMPGEPGEKMQMAFKAAMTVAEKVSKVNDRTAKQDLNISLADLKKILMDVENKAAGSKCSSYITQTFLKQVISKCSADDERKPIAEKILQALPSINKAARAATAAKKVAEKAALVAAATAFPTLAAALPAAAPPAVAEPAAPQAPAASARAPAPPLAAERPEATAAVAMPPPPPLAKGAALLFTHRAQIRNNSRMNVVRVAACEVQSVDIAASTVFVKVVAVLEGGRHVEVPQAPGGPHAGKSWGDYMKELDAVDADVHLTLPLAPCVPAAVPDGTEHGPFKTVLQNYITERKRRLKAAPKKGKGGGSIL